MNNYVNFELAKLLYHKKYIGKSIISYDFNGVIINSPYYGQYFTNNTENGNSLYEAPTIIDVIMWLYDNHNQWIVVKPYLGQWKFELHKKPNPLSSCTPIHNTVLYNNPTKAYEAAIEYVLTNLIK